MNTQEQSQPTDQLSEIGRKVRAQQPVKSIQPTELLSRVERVLATVPVEEPKTITVTFINEIGRHQSSPKATKINLPGEVFREGRMVQSTPRLLEAILGNTAIVGPEDLGALSRTEKEMRETLDEAKKHSSISAQENFHAQTRDLSAKIVGGGPIPEEVTLRSNAAMHTNERALQAALVAKLVKLTVGHMALSGSILAEAKRRVEDWISQRETTDRAECEAFGISYLPSAVWMAACHLYASFNTHRIPKPGTYEFPSFVLRGIVNFTQKAK